MKEKNEKLVIYQVLPRLFGNDNATNQPNGTFDQNGSGKLSAFDTKTLTEIKQMGITHIWYTGIIEHATQTDYTSLGITKDHPAIVKGIAGSPYAIKDYFDIDPDLAENVNQRMHEFEELVIRTHQAGMKVIIDFVPNHVARQYHSDAKPKDIADLGENDNIHTTFDKDNNFYYMPGQSLSLSFEAKTDCPKYEEEPAKATGNDRFDAYPGRHDWYETIKLNYGVDYLNQKSRHFEPIPDTWHKMLQILLFWSSKKIDVFRCDMAEMVPVEFWAWVIPQIKANYPRVQFIAEIYNPDQYHNFLWNGKFDYLYDKVGLYDTLRDIICQKQPASALSGCWQSVEGIQSQMVYFLENHDEQRIASDFFAGDPCKAIPGMITISTMHKNPLLIYFGQELGEKGMDIEGFSGKDGRTSIFDYWCLETIRNWRNKGKYDERKLNTEQKKLKELYRTLLPLCNKENTIKNGSFFDLMYANYQNPRFDSERQYVFTRQFGKELLLIVANFSEKEVETGIFIPAHLFEFVQIDPVRLGSGMDLLTGEKIPAKLSPDGMFPVTIQPFNGRIIKFKAK